ncbi:MAG: hypothetical protein M1546_01985 [Chloroflexi bacterium]|nr:hypothetical protein [Chloroflexota bacterium]
MAIAEPIRLHPDNPHYLWWRGRPTVLITSANHYGSVLNADFDPHKYLETLAAHGFNQTRLFSGCYCENNAFFKIHDNVLAPALGRLICPWARSDTPGYANGGNKFDLTRWDEAYFERLLDFTAEAGRRCVVVEMVLFCPFYDDTLWSLSPMNVANNVNGIGQVDRLSVYTLSRSALTAVQEAMTHRIVQALQPFDNVYYEICNEPYWGNVTLPWQAHIAGVIADTEASSPHQHLIAQGICNGAMRVEDPDPRVSIFNFHYAHPPDAVPLNDDLNRVIADDETGFEGSDDTPYRTEAWDFIIAGGGAFSHLDYSFTVGHEDGSAPINAPGGGGVTYRKQLEVLTAFINGLDFAHMRPDDTVITGGVPAGVTARALVQPGRAYALYLKGGHQATLAVNLLPGAYQAEWVNVQTGAVDKVETFEHAGGERALASPAYVDDIALRILADTNKV